MPYSNLKCEILRVLKEEGYIENFEMIASDNKKDITGNSKILSGTSCYRKN